MANRSEAFGELTFPIGFDHDLMQWFLSTYNVYSIDHYYRIDICKDQIDGYTYDFEGTGRWSIYGQIESFPKEFTAGIKEHYTKEAFNIFKKELAKFPEGISLEYVDVEPSNEILYTCQCRWKVCKETNEFIYEKIQLKNYPYTAKSFDILDLEWTEELQMEDIIPPLIIGNDNCPPILETTLRLFGAYRLIEDFLEENDNFTDWDGCIQMLIDNKCEIIDNRWLTYKEKDYEGGLDYNA